MWRTVVSSRSTRRAAPAANGVLLTPLQEEGAARAGRVLEQYCGVVVADSVGMGKTFVALRLIEQARAAQRDAVVIAPATLRFKWKRALGTGTASVGVVSHARLPRTGVAGAVRSGLHGMYPLIVVDEAHQFRNPRTARYRALSHITSGAHVVLLTATPINNRLADLYWLLRLFLGDGDLRAAGVPDLRSALLDDGASGSASAKAVVAQVVVRRTRADLPASAPGCDFRFPRRASPMPVYYDLESCYPQLAELPTILERLPLAPFRLSQYTENSGHSGTDALVRIGLIKRLESSTWAFERSIERLLRFVQLSVEAAAGGGFLRARDAGRGDPLQLSLTGLLARPLPARTDRDRLLQDLALDCTLLQQLREAAATARDAKSERLESLLGTVGPNPRVVFTQYVETAERLFERLRRFRVALLHGSNAELVSGTVSRRAVLERFAPRALGCPAPSAHERIDTLICTDVLSEGLDLQDAQHCISYDLPWNPVRLMQRIGRIDRMQSPHEQVFSWYFTPNHTIEGLLGLLQRLRRKIRTIEGSVGREAPVLADMRGRTRHLSRQQSQPDIWGRLASLAAKGQRATHADVTIVARVRCASTRGCLAVLGIRAAGYGWWEAIQLHGVPDRGRVPGERQIGRLLLDIYDAGFPREGVADASDAVRRALEQRRRRHVSRSEQRPRSMANRMAAKQIRRGLARMPGGAPPHICRAAERMLLRLREGLPIAQERALAAIIRNASDADFATMLGQIEAITSSRPQRVPAARITAILIVDGVHPG